MAEPKAPDLQEKKEEKKETPYEEVHKKSYAKIVKEGIERAKSETPVEKVEEEKTEKVEKAEPKPTDEKELEEKTREAKSKREADKKEELAKEVAKAAKEAAREGLAEEIKAREDKYQKELQESEKKKALEEKKSRKPNWTGKDTQGNPTPMTYDEIFEESKKAAIDEIMARIEEREEEQRQVSESEMARKTQKEEEAKATQKQFEDNINKQIEEDLNDLYSTGKLPTIKDPEDKNDEGVLAKDALFKAGAELNNERIAKGLPPVTSIKLIFYEHYKAPNKQPAGADAPIMGNNTPKVVNDDGKIDYQALHNKSYRQIAQEALARMRGRG